jgi:DNA-binding HxlR family transcriptional regulator
VDFYTCEASDFSRELPKGVGTREAIAGLMRSMLKHRARLHGRSVAVICRHAEVPPRVEYSLTSLAASLFSAIEHLAAWCAEQRTEIRRHQDAYEMSARRSACLA